jgi:hypothetical protein
MAISKARNLPKSSKNLDDFITFFLKMWQFLFEKFLKSSIDHVAWDTLKEFPVCLCILICLWFHT